MSCKNCGANFNQCEKFCPFCGTKIKVKDIARTTFIKSIISLILFFVVLLITIFSMIEFYKDDSGAGGWIIIILIILTWTPLIISIGLSSTASSSIKKYKSEGLEIPNKVKILSKINKFQIPLIIFVFVIGFSLKENKYNGFIHKKLDDLYNSNYKIINRCSVSNEGGDNYEIVVIKLENFDYPIISNFDWAHDDYEDNYDELKQADELNYYMYINSIFEDTVISLMDFHNYQKYKQINLSILLTTNYLNNQNDLKLKVKQIINNYVSQFPDYSFSFDLYFTEKIDRSLLQEYYVYMSGTGNCHDDFDLKVGSSITRAIYIYVDEDTNIDTEINDSFYNRY